MADKVSTDQYGRKTWNVEAYAEDAKKGKTEQNTPDEVAASLRDKSYLQHRTQLLDQSVLAVNTHTLINSESSTSTFGKNKRFGFFCPVCDLSFRDTLALIDHINSPQHVQNARRIAKAAGSAVEEEVLDSGVKRATPEEVAKTIEDLVAQLLRAKAATGADSLQERIRKRQAFEAKKLARKREKKKRQKSIVEEAEESDVQKLMGIQGFGSTKIY